MSFGDVNLSEEAIRGPPHNPGAGGWPTVRYFNKETGLDGGNYVKKTEKAMCEELGNDELMTAYVEEYAGTSLCQATTENGCNDREKEYISKFKDQSISQLQQQQDRLTKMAAGKMKPELMTWLNKRKNILRQLIAVHDEL